MLIKFLVLSMLFIGVAYSATTAELTREIDAEYARFIEDPHSGIAKSVQFIEHLMKQAMETLDKTVQERIAKKIALIIGSGVGVGGMGSRPANLKETAVITNATVFLVQQFNADKAWFNLYQPANPHQQEVARLATAAEPSRTQIEAVSLAIREANRRIAVRNDRVAAPIATRVSRRGGGHGHRGPNYARAEAEQQDILPTVPWPW
jgi:hypothetical protein